MLSRRLFVKNAAAISLGFTGLHTFMGCSSPSDNRVELSLVPDPAGIVDLPQGFTYSIISKVGNAMADGFIVPARPDGMATFLADNGLTILIRNHEVDNNAEMGPFGGANEMLSQLTSDQFYDFGFGETPAIGGTTTLIYDTEKQEVVREFLSLIGTRRNCAGGPTPWGSWITCEETTVRSGDDVEQDHGYNFEVPATLNPAIATPTALKEMGRFNHEAVAVEPNSGIVYQTEDRHDGLIYRFIPNIPGELVQGGRLQALVAIDQPGLDTRNWDNDAIAIGQSIPVRWIDMEDIDAPEDDLRLRGFEQGAARFARGEGMWYGEGTIYFACTNGGKEKKGQIWKYIPSPHEGTAQEEQQPATLELFIEPNNGAIVENADNITIAPWGDLIVCEDGPGQQNLLRVTPAGNVIRFGSNRISESEFAGSTFSPDGSTLFVNIQVDGLTLAITGPWNQL